MGSDIAPVIQYVDEVEPAEQGFSPVYMNKQCKKKGCINTPKKGIYTLQDAVLQSQRMYGDLKCLGSPHTTTKIDGKGKEEVVYEKYTWRTYNEVCNDALAFGSALIKLRLVPSIKEFRDYSCRFISVFAPNIESWYIIDLCCMLHSLQLAPLYDTLGEDTVKYVLNQTNVTTLALTSDHLELLIKLKNDQKIPRLATLIVLDTPTQNQLNQAKYSFKVYTFQELVDYGKQNPVEPVDALGSDIWTLCYTSGTTGDPKGVIITQAAFLSQIAAIEKAICILPGKEAILSYLPLAHVAERLMYFSTFYYGGQIGIFESRNKKELTKALALVRPTLFLSVPRLYNKFYAIFQAKIKALTGCKACLVKNGIRSKGQNVPKNKYNHCFYDAIMKKFKMALGGRVKLMTTGSAPISNEVKNFFKIVIGCPMIEAYGQTECAGISNFVDQNDPTDGHVGGCSVNNEMRLQDVPSMDYLVTDTDKDGNSTPRGEVLVRGINVTPGYYKMEEKTKSTIVNGWLHTGDIGMILPNGALKIIDRKKNIFKLSQGEYVAPEKIENIYVKFPYIEACFLHGVSVKDHCVAIIEVEPNGMKAFLGENGITDYSLTDDNVKMLIWKDMYKRGKQNKLHGFEQAKNIFLTTETFENAGVLTNTFKLKRHQAKLYFANQIAAMYREGNLQLKK